MLNIYTIEKDTLTDIADAIRNKYNFKDKINPKDFPRYISNDSDNLWLTHYNTKGNGSGSIYTDLQNFNMEPGEFTAKFKKNPEVSNGYELTDTWNSYNVVTKHPRFKTSDLTLLSQGRPYTTSGTKYSLSSSYVNPDRLHDDGVRLTDGNLGLSCIDPLSTDYSAWTGAFDAPVEVLIDLGSAKRIGRVKIYGIFNFWGVLEPSNVKIGYSSTGRDNDPFKMYDITPVFTLIGEGNSYINSSGTLVPTKLYEITLDFETLKYSRYVKIQCWGRFVWLNEVQVYGITHNKSYYGYKQSIAATNSIDIRSGEIAIYDNKNEWEATFSSLKTEEPEEYAQYSSWWIGKSTEGAGFYNLKQQLSIMDTLNFQSGDKIIVFKSATNNIDISCIAGAADKIFYIKDNIIEYLSTTQIVLPHTITIGSDEFLYKVKNGGSQADTMMERASDWKNKEIFIFENIDLINHAVATDTPWLSWQDSKYRSTATYDIMQNNSIKIDGELYDSGWRTGGWYNIDGSNGYYSSGEEGLNYSYKIKTDENYLYLGFINPTLGIDTENGKSEITALRLWLKTNKNASVYTHFYGFSYVPNSGLIFQAYQNTSSTGNSSLPLTKSGAAGAYKNDTDNLSIEIRIPLAEFGGSEEFEYIISHGNIIGSQAVILYAQKINTVPYEQWDSNNADKVIVSDYELDSDEIVKLIEEELL